MCERVCTSVQRVCGGGEPSLLSPGGRCGGRRSSAQGSHSLEVLSAQDSVGRAVTLLSAWSRSSPGGPSWSRRSRLRLSVPHLVSSGCLFLGRVISKCVVRDRTWNPRAGWNTQQGRIGSPSGKQRTRVFQACCYDFIKAFKPCFPGERQKEKVRLGCVSLASLRTVDRSQQSSTCILARRERSDTVTAHSTASPRPTRLFPVETGGLCGPEDPARQWAVGVQMASCTRRPALCVISPRKMR